MYLASPAHVRLPPLSLASNGCRATPYGVVLAFFFVRCVGSRNGRRGSITEPGLTKVMSRAAIFSFAIKSQHVLDDLLLPARTIKAKFFAMIPTRPITSGPLHLLAVEPRLETIMQGPASKAHGADLSRKSHATFEKWESLRTRRAGVMRDGYGYSVWSIITRAVSSEDSLRHFL